MDTHAPDLIGMHEGEPSRTPERVQLITERVQLWWDRGGRVWAERANRTERDPGVVNGRWEWVGETPQLCIIKGCDLRHMDAYSPVVPRVVVRYQNVTKVMCPKS